MHPLAKQEIQSNPTSMLKPKTIPRHFADLTALGEDLATMAAEAQNPRLHRQEQRTAALKALTTALGASQTAATILQQLAQEQ